MLTADALLDLARARVRLVEPALRVETEGEERDETAVGAQHAQLARFLAGDLADDPLDIGAVDCDLPAGRRLCERLEMGLHRVHLGDRGADRALHPLRDRVRLLERQVAGQLEVERDLGPSVHLDEREVVDLAHARHGERCGVRALAHVLVVERLDVDDDVAARQRALDRGLDGVGGGVTLPDCGAGRDADDDVGELPSRRLPHPQSA